MTGAAPSPFVDDLTAPPPLPEPVSPSPGSTRPAATRRGANSRTEPTPVDPLTAQRIEALRALRNELRDGKPAYVVFDNRTMEAIARRWPRSEDELRRVPGIGPAKLARYGTAVLDLVTREQAE